MSKDREYTKTIKAIERACTVPLNNILKVINCRDSDRNKLHAIGIICGKSLDAIKTCVEEELK